MKDGARVYPVNKLIMHHAVSDLFGNWDDIDVQDWFSNVGRGRAYGNGSINPNHEHPSRGGLTYAQAHFCLHPYTKDGNKYGWRLTELMKFPWDNVAWHAGNWGINQQSIGIETAGNYVGQQLDTKALMLVADTFRGHDQYLGGGLEVYGHKQFSATACPGQIIDQIGTLIDMINNPGKWNEILWPAPKPEPAKPAVETPQIPQETVGEGYSPAKRFVVTTDTFLQNIPGGSGATAELYTAGRVIENIVSHVKYSNGLGFYQTAYSKENNTSRGFRDDTLKEIIEESPQPPTQPETPANDGPTEPVPEQPVESTPDVPTTNQPAKKPSWVVLLLVWLFSRFTRKKTK